MTEHGAGADGEKVGCVQRICNKVTNFLSSCFFSLGFKIGTYPERFIIGCVLVCALCGIGLLAFHEETEIENLWVPDGADVIDHKAWIDDHYPSTIIIEQIIAVGENNNVLTPTGLLALWNIYNESSTISASGYQLGDVCVMAGSNCMVYSILELWSYDENQIKALTQAQIQTKINDVKTSPMYPGRTFEMTRYLGLRTVDSNGDTTAAQAAYIQWLTQGSDAMKDKTEAWEEDFIAMGQRGFQNIKETFVFAGRTRNDEGGNAVGDDIGLLTMGYVIVIVFVVTVLGKFNFYEQRFYLACGGLLCVGLSVLVSVGLSSAFQMDYGPIQSILPFMLLGVGVDGMFVIMSVYNGLGPEESKLPIPEKMSHVLAHSGVAITVTSLTDFVAFMIGATTIIPALRSFCIYAGVGILALYLLQAMLFSAFVVLDLRRMERGADACLTCCVTYDLPYQANKCSQWELGPYIFKNFIAEYGTKLPWKIVMVMISVGMFGANCYGLSQLKQYFDPDWFLPSDSYAFEYTEAAEKYFPDNGANGYVYCGDINYFGMQTEIEKLDDLLNTASFMQRNTTDSWFRSLTDWLPTSTEADVTSRIDANKYPNTDGDFVYLANKLTTAVPRTSSYLTFNTSITNIPASRFPYRHIYLDDADSQIDAMDGTRDLIDNAGLTNCFPYSMNYLTWETNKVIRVELLRNLGVALICVFCVTLVLIANVWTSLIVFIGVVFTLVDVAGTMYFWDLTIDTVTSVILILSIGLAVDYSAHIGHYFMTQTGTRSERSKETVREMGPPVFYGGFSTFLAFVLLSYSTSYVFKTFFKVNFLVVIYGLFHGLFLLPALLSWFGPPPYPNAERKSKEPEEEPKVQGTNNQAFSMQDESQPTKDQPVVLPPIRNAPQGKQQEINLSDQNNHGSSPPPSYTSPSQSDGSPPPEYPESQSVRL